MYLLYSIAISMAFVALLPYFLYQAIARGKYIGGLKERLGFLPESARGRGRTIWVHAVSVGELLAAAPLIERLLERAPDHRLVVSTITKAGQQLARSRMRKLGAETFYFPFDWAFSVRRALNHVRPSLVIILESELWPNFLRECRRRQIATALVNGRISRRSFDGYKRFGWFFSRVMRDLSLLIMQSESDAERAKLLGAPPERIRVCGNMKYDAAAEPDPAWMGAIAEELDSQFQLSGPAQLIVAGSTAPGEEEILIEALLEIRRRAGLERARLLLAPRHPERFDEVAALVERFGLRLGRRSKREPQAEADVILLDTIGELMAAYSFASVAFVGGSLVPRGGHNPLEPAIHAKPIIVGPHTENFSQIVSDFLRADAMIQVSRAEELAGQLIRLLEDGRAAAQMGARARSLVDMNRGATECAMAAIMPLIEPGRLRD